MCSDGCIAMNNNAFGLVSNNVLRSCNLGVGTPKKSKKIDEIIPRTQRL